eukprot:gene423-457_t
MSENEPVDGEEIETKALDYGKWDGIDIIPSLCMNCGATGETRLMLHKIPHFRELVIASFRCDECGERNNEVTFGGEIQLNGSLHELKVMTPGDLNRQIIKSDSATVRIRELDFEIPANTQKGEINTIEGVLRTAAKNLGLYQAERMAENPMVGQKVAGIILSLSRMADGNELPFHIELDDPAGNSYLENPHAPQPDPQLKVLSYVRSRDQDISLGLNPDQGVYKDDLETNYSALLEKARAPSPTILPDIEAEKVDENQQHLGRGEAVSIPSECPHCGVMGESLTALTDIPHFKEVIIMAFDCKNCGFRTNEVKAGGAVPVKGTEVQLFVTCLDDLKRDVLKSDSAMILVPELELEVTHGSLGGLYTTVEGLLQKVSKSLLGQNPFMLGDAAVLNHSATDEISVSRQRFKMFLDRLDKFSKGQELPFTICLRDPLGNSFISAPLGSSLPPEMDSNLTIVDYTRSFEENEEFGLNDINTKDFEVLPEGQSDEPVLLPDRLSQIYVKQPDHPSMFAKGTCEQDSTTNGFYFGAHHAETRWLAERVVGEETVIGGENAENIQASTFSSADTGIAKRVFFDDSSLDFIPRETFYGARDGFVFRLGSKGLGYYADRDPLSPPRSLVNQN